MAAPAHDLQVTQELVSGLRTYHRNPRRGNTAVIAQSLTVNGQYRAICANRGTHTGRPNEVLAGNHTLMAARDLGWETVAVTWVDVDDDQCARIVAVDNRSADLGEYDERLLLELLGDLPDLDGTGYEPGDLEDLEKALEDSGAVAGPASSVADQDAEVLEPRDGYHPVTRLGDVWQLGPHRLLCGDCTAGDTARLLGIADGVDLILTDPPYCSGGFQESGKSAGSVGTTAAHKQIANDRLSTRGYMALLKAAIPAVPATYAYVFTDWRMWTYLFDVVESCGYGVRSMVVWDKGTPGMGRGWRSQHELVMWAAKQTPPFDKHMSGHGNVIQASRTGNDLHTTQKPVTLCAELLSVVEFASMVYDPFAGSGTTLMACHETGRTAYLAELDPAYCDVICRRYQEHTGIKPTRDGQPHDFTEESA